MALPKINRIKGKKYFTLILKKGKTKKSEFLTLKFLESPSKESRFGFLVSQKVSKKAVIRNKVKRRLSEIVRQKLKEIKKPIDGVFIAKPGIEKEKFQKIKEEIEKIFQKIENDQGNF